MSEPATAVFSHSNIIECSEANAAEWDEFLTTSQDASFYQLYGWNRINKAHFNHQVFNFAAMENGKIVGVFPLVFINSRLFGKILCSMPFVNFGGPSANDKSIERKLLDCAFDLSKNIKCDYLEIRSTRILDECLPTSKHKVSMTVELTSDPEIIWNNYSRNHRKNIRRVIKNDLTVKSGHIELLDQFYHVLANSWRSLGTPIYSKTYFKSVLSEFPENTSIFICYDNMNIPIAAAFIGHYKDTVEGMWIGTHSNYRKLQPQYILYWEMIKFACLNGFKWFHLGRSSVDSGGEQFKTKWNAIPKQLYWQYYLNNIKEVPQLNVNNPKFQLAIQVWQKLPLGLTTTIGPVVAKSIP